MKRNKQNNENDTERGHLESSDMNKDKNTNTYNSQP